MSANPEIYPYTDDPAKDIQFCTVPFYDCLTDGQLADPSIFIGKLNLPPEENPFGLTVWSVGWYKGEEQLPQPEGVYYVTVRSAIKRKTRSQTMFGLCDRDGLYTNMVGYGSFFRDYDTFTYASGTTSYKSHVNGNDGYRVATDLVSNVSEYEANNHKFYPVVKLKRGQIVVTMKIIALPEPSSWDMSRNTLEKWRSSVRVFNDEASYRAMKDQYPYIIELDLYIWYKGNGQSSRLTRLFPFTKKDTTLGDDEYVWLHGESGTVSAYVDGDTSDQNKYINGLILPRASGAQSIHYYSGNTIFEGDIIYPLNFQYTFNEPTDFVAWYIKYGMDCGEEKTINVLTTYNGIRRSVEALFVYAPSDIINKFKNIITNMGFAYSDQQNVAQAGDIETNPNIWTPTYNSNGDIIYNSATNDSTQKYDYLNNNLETQPNFDPNSSDQYDPDEEEEQEDFPDPEDEDPNTEVDKIPVETPALATYGVFNKFYALNKNELQSLADYLWNTDLDTWQQIKENLSLVGENRMDAIINVMMFPFEIPTTTGDTEYIRLGRQTTDTVGHVVSNSQTMLFDLGECYFYGIHQNFLDYEPYTRGWLYVPYFGVFQIPIQQFMYHWVSVKMSVDLMTGSAQVVVYSKYEDKEYPIIYKNGVVGMQIPVTGRNIGDVLKNYIKTAKSALTAVGNTAAVLGGNSGAVTGAMSSLIDFGVNAMSAQSVPIESEGSASPQCGMCMPQNCYFLLEYPVMKSGVPDYGRLIGYACYKSGSVGSFSGFSKFENVKLDISHATETEKAEIKSLLANGVYL